MTYGEFNTLTGIIITEVTYSILGRPSEVEAYHSDNLKKVVKRSLRQLWDGVELDYNYKQLYRMALQVKKGTHTVLEGELRIPKLTY